MSATVYSGDPWTINERDFPYSGDQEAQLRFLARYAMLAPSTRNTQPWAFAIEGPRISLLANRSRWLPVSDPDGRELMISIGCALENLLLAAEHFGFTTKVSLFPDPENRDYVAAVRCETGAAPASMLTDELFLMIPERCTHHEEYDGVPVAPNILGLFHGVCNDEAVHLLVTADLGTRAKVDELMTRADAIEFANPAFREELGHCIGRGNFGGPWLIAALGQLAVSYLNLGRSTARKDHEVLMSSPILGILCAQHDDPVTWVAVGRTYERLALLSAAHGLSIQPLSQLIQVPEVRAELAPLLPLEGLIPLQPFRLGYPKMPKRHTPRNPLESMLV